MGSLVHEGKGKGMRHETQEKPGEGMDGGQNTRGHIKEPSNSRIKRGDYILKQ